jgi:catechol 2,3-dioxygenase-like lactoylglutathione lyase family enzyme
MEVTCLDHVVIAVRDLESATASYRAILGLRPSWKSVHATYGTENVLFRLGNTYLELLAPAAQDEGVPEWSRVLRGHLEGEGEGLYALALGTRNLDVAVARARHLGLEVSDAGDGEGRDVDSGAHREWRNALIDPASTRGVRAFFIQHRSPADALPMAEPEGDGIGGAKRVDHVVIACPDLETSFALWTGSLGLQLAASRDFPERGTRLYFLRLGDLLLELAGRVGEGDETEGEAQGASDSLWGVALEVDDVAAAVERVRAAGIGVRGPRPGRARGTLVADMDSKQTHGVRLLFIQKSGA